MASMTVSFTILMVKQFALCKLQCPEFVHFLKGLKFLKIRVTNCSAEELNLYKNDSIAKR